MSNHWGPHFIMPSELLKKYSGTVLLRDYYDEGLLRQELEELGIEGAVKRVSNPWCYRKKSSTTWIEIGESADSGENFPVRWNTLGLENGQYQVLGLMHVFVKNGKGEKVLIGERVTDVSVQN